MGMLSRMNLSEYEFDWIGCWVELWNTAKAREADWDKSELLACMAEIERTETLRISALTHPNAPGRKPSCICGACEICRRRAVKYQAHRLRVAKRRQA
jgi:hypothetical protein